MKNIKIKKQKLICILIVLISVFFIIYTNQFKLDEKFYSKKYFPKGNDIKPKNIHSCSPIKVDYTKYFIIDNVKYPKSVALYLNKSINFECLNKSSNLKRILLWNSFFEKESYGYGFGKVKPFSQNNCPVTNCELTNDKSKINESDFVVVHMRNEFDLNQAPKHRPTKQRWIFALFESPVHSSSMVEYNGFFNLTSTYRQDSDFHRLDGAYQKFIWKINSSFDENFDFLKEKSNFAAAIISNCHAKSLRLDYINELKKYSPVDVYGSCGKPCPAHFKNNIPGDCKEIIGAEYKFYLSFENSICKYYITEKFFQILKYNIIPVTLGGGFYDYYVSMLFEIAIIFVCVCYIFTFRCLNLVT
jgi:alpha-1,3-fucosyltransferase